MQFTHKKTVLGIVLALVAALAIIYGSKAAASATEGNEPCVPSDAWTETIEHPEVGHFETVPGTPGQHYSWNGGKLDVNNPPTEVPPSDNWQANTEQEPHDNGVGNPATWVNDSLHYTANSKGHASWFYYVHPTPDTEVWVVDEEAWTEVIEHPAVDCPPDPVVVTPVYSAFQFCAPRGLEIRVEDVLVGVGSGETDTYTYNIAVSNRWVTFDFTAKDGFVFEGGETTFSDMVMIPILRCPVPEDPEDPEEPRDPTKQEDPPKDEPKDEPRTTKAVAVPTSVDAGL